MSHKANADKHPSLPETGPSCILPVFLPAIAAFFVLSMWIYPLVPENMQKHYPSFVKSWYRLPGDGLRLSDPDSARLPSRDPIDTHGELESFDGRPAGDVSDNWPCFRGEGGKNIKNISEQLDMVRSFGPEGPPRLWEVQLGEGYAGPAVNGGMVYVMDYDRKKRANSLRCFSFADGREIWRRNYEVDIRRQHGISRTVPAVNDDIVVAIGPKCTIVCCEAKTGRYLWGMDLVARYGTTVPRWYTGQCPMISFEGNVILAPSGKSLMVCVEGKSGKVVWEVPNPKNWKMSHSSVLYTTLEPEDGGLTTNLYLYTAQGGIACVRENKLITEEGEEKISGEIAFLLEDWEVNTATIPTPVDMGGGKILLCGGYGAGSGIMELKVSDDGKVSAEITKKIPPEVFGSDQHTPVFHENHVYGVLPRGVGENSCRMRCLNIDMEPVWTSGPEDTFGLGPYMLVTGMIIAMNDEGVLTLADLNINRYRRLARADILDGDHSWAPMAMVNGRLLVRDENRLVCLDMRKKDRQ